MPAVLGKLCKRPSAATGGRTRKSGAASVSFPDAWTEDVLQAVTEARIFVTLSTCTMVISVRGRTDRTEEATIQEFVLLVFTQSFKDRVH